MHLVSIDIIFLNCDKYLNITKLNNNQFNFDSVYFTFSERLPLYYLVHILIRNKETQHKLLIIVSIQFNIGR